MKNTTNVATQAPQVLEVVPVAEVHDDLLEVAASVTIELTARFGLSVEEASSLVVEGIKLHLAEVEAAPGSAIFASTMHCSYAEKLLLVVTPQAQQLARAHALQMHRTALSRIYKATCRTLEAFGFNFDLLVTWHQHARQRQL